MAVSRDAAKRIFTKAAVEAGLTGPALAWFHGWGDRWLRTFVADAAYTDRVITIMARNAAGHAKANRHA